MLETLAVRAGIGQLAAKQFNDLEPDFPKNRSRDFFSAGNSGFGLLGIQIARSSVRNKGTLMAKTNRNRKLLLSEAWMQYWPILFPGRGDWSSDLEAEIRRCLYFPGKTGAFLSEVNSQVRSPAWAGDLKIVIKDNSVAFEFMDKNFCTVPLFSSQLRTVLSNSASNNPLTRIDKETELSRVDREACRDMFIAAVRSSGHCIQNRLLAMITEAESPTFEVFCQPNGDVFAKEKRIPAFGCSKVCRIDVTMNTLQDRMGQAVYSNVQIKKRSPSTSEAGRHGAFHDQDAVLLVDMKKLIDEGTEPTVSAAALAVVKNASSRSKSSDKSVLARLQRKFSARHPGYTSRLRRKPK